MSNWFLLILVIGSWVTSRGFPSKSFICCFHRCNRFCWLVTFSLALAVLFLLLTLFCFSFRFPLTFLLPPIVFLRYYPLLHFYLFFNPFSLNIIIVALQSLKESCQRQRNEERTTNSHEEKVSQVFTEKYHYVIDVTSSLWNSKTGRRSTVSMKEIFFV